MIYNIPSFSYRKIVGSEDKQIWYQWVGLVFRSTGKNEIHKSLWAVKW